MAIIGSDGLSLLVGDGAGTEVFNALKGCIITQLNVSQRAHASTAVATDAWQTQVGTSHREAAIECEAYATDDASVLRLKSLALSGAAGNFKLQLRGAETALLSAVVTQYQEIIAAGEIKRMKCRLETSGAISLV